jgi:predicted nucleic acid-binding Zn ribbon protein
VATQNGKALRTLEEEKAEMATQTIEIPSPCPNCGGALLPGRAFCRPSCRVRFEWRQRPRSLFETEVTLESEWETAEPRDQPRPGKR